MKVPFIIALLASILSAGCILNVTHYKRSDGRTTYVGYVYNDGTTSMDASARVRGDFYDAAGNLIDSERGSICRGVDPKGIVPFAIDLPAGKPEAASVKWSLEATPVASAYLATGIETDITNSFDAGGQTHLYGEMHNTSSSTYVLAFPCASWTDADGNVVRVTWGSAAGVRFNPGDTLPFAIVVDTPPAGSTMHFFPDAGVTNVPATVAPVAVDVSAAALQHAYVSSAMVGGSRVTTGIAEVTNSGSKQFLPIVAATIKDASGKLLAVNEDSGPCSVAAAPGSFSYVEYVVDAPPSVTGDPAVTIQGYQYNGTPVSFPTVSPLATQSVGAATVRVSGTITNNSSATLQRARVCVGAYAADGTVHVIGLARPQLPSGGLAAGATASFSVDLSGASGLSTFKAIADGYVN